MAEVVDQTLPLNAIEHVSFDKNSSLDAQTDAVATVDRDNILDPRVNEWEVIESKHVHTWCW